MEKLKENRNYIIHNLCQVYSMLWGIRVGKLVKEVYAQFEGGRQHT